MITQKETIRKLIAEQACAKVENVHNKTTFGDLELDSLDVVELSMMIEDDFGVSIPNAAFSGVNDDTTVDSFFACMTPYLPKEAM